MQKASKIWTVIVWLSFNAKMKYTEGGSRDGSNKEALPECEGVEPTQKQKKILNLMLSEVGETVTGDVEKDGVLRSFFFVPWFLWASIEPEEMHMKMMSVRTLQSPPALPVPVQPPDSPITLPMAQDSISAPIGPPVPAPAALQWGQSPATHTLPYKSPISQPGLSHHCPQRDAWCLDLHST